MPEQKKTPRQTQEEKHLALLGVIEECLADKGDIKQNAFDLAEYCNMGKMTIRNANPINYNNWNMFFKGNWMGAVRFRHKGDRIGQSKVYREENSCCIDVVFGVGNPEYENFAIAENLSEVIWRNVKFCEGCLSTCAPGRDMTVLGKTLHNVCGYKTEGYLRFINPDAESLHCIKKLLEFRKGLISAWKG